MFAQLGTHIFTGMKAPASWGENHAAKIGRIPHVNTKDALQKTGDELAEISLSLQYSCEFCEPADEITALKKSMQTGEILPFISGTGTIIGSYIITGVDVVNKSYTPDGILTAATVTVKLLEHPVDAIPSGREKTIPTGSALKSAAPTLAEPLKTPDTPGIGITTSLSKAKTTITQMKTTVDKVKKGITTVKKGVQNVKELADNTKQLYTTAKTKVEATAKIIRRAKELPTSLSSAISYAENLSKLSNTADIGVLEMNVKELADSAEKVNRHAAPVVSFVATREGGD